MLEQVNFDAIITPFSEDSPAGDELRYTNVYDDIKECRRADDDIPQGDWQRENKSADWDKVIRLSLDALTNKSKDFQVAAWLTEALAMEEGFDGVESGLRVITALLNQFWDSGYPLVEDDDYDYRVAPFEFLNDRLTAAIQKIPITDIRSSQGYSYTKWKESRDVGYETDSRGERRSGMIAEGKLTAEEFDLAVAKSSAAYYKSLADSIAACVEAIGEMDTVVDLKFGSHAPRISEIKQILDECNRFVVKVCREQKGLKDAVDLAIEEPGKSAPTSDVKSMADGSHEQVGSSLRSGAISLPAIRGEETEENTLWNEAVRIMQGGAFKDALALLLSASSSQASERGKNRYRFLVAKLCLKAGRPDLAKPIMEQLHTMINEQHLENWESPFWISEILESLYQCLMSADYADEDPARAQELFRRICTLDVTKVIGTRG
jgi:type VI secretion system protein ImpA